VALLGWTVLVRTRSGVGKWGMDQWVPSGMARHLVQKGRSVPSRLLPNGLVGVQRAANAGASRSLPWPVRATSGSVNAPSAASARLSSTRAQAPAPL
jgi:hypothetical protein